MDEEITTLYYNHNWELTTLPLKNRLLVGPRFMQ